MGKFVVTIEQNDDDDDDGGSSVSLVRFRSPGMAKGIGRCLAAMNGVRQEDAFCVAAEIIECLNALGATTGAGHWPSREDATKKLVDAASEFIEGYEEWLENSDE